MTLTDGQKPVYDAVLWLAEALRQCHPQVALPRRWRMDTTEPPIGDSIG